jgi:hypothetical protein
MSDMHPEMINEIAESRGYDRGFTAGTLHAHELVGQYMKWIEEYISVLEDEGDCQREIACYQTQWNALDSAKKLIRTGHFDCDEI